VVSYIAPSGAQATISRGTYEKRGSGPQRKMNLCHSRQTRNEFRCKQWNTSHEHANFWGFCRVVSFLYKM